MQTRYMLENGLAKCPIFNNSLIVSGFCMAFEQEFCSNGQKRHFHSISLILECAYMQSLNLEAWHVPKHILFHWYGTLREILQNVVAALPRLLYGLFSSSHLRHIFIFPYFARFIQFNTVLTWNPMYAPSELRFYALQALYLQIICSAVYWISCYG